MGASEYFNIPYLVVLDNEITTVYPTVEDMAFVLVWRKSLSPARFRMSSDEYWQYVKDHGNLVEICRNARIWERAKIRGIIDLRAKPIRFEVIGRKFLPYLTEWEVLMRMVE